MKSEYFQTLVEAIALGSFSKAADKLFITQSAVSRRIQFLEDHLGYPLIDRSGPVLVPTEVGRIVLEKAHKMLALEKELKQAIHEYGHKPGVTFCCTPAFGIAYLPKIMKNFMLLNSSTTEMNFSFDLPDKVVEGLKGGLFQAGVIEHFQNYNLVEFETFELPKGEFVFVTSPSLFIDENEIEIDQLAPFDLYIGNAGCCSNKLLTMNMNSISRNPGIFPRTIICDDIHLIINTVLEGNGITFISRSLVEKHLQQGLLREHHVAGFNHSHLRTLILNNGTPDNQLLRNFASEIRAMFE